MSRKRATLTDLLNDLTFRTTFDKYKTLATSRFEWDGLPEGIKEKHIENYLFNHGKAAFFKAPGMSYMCLEAQDAGQLDVYGDPLYYNAVGFQYHKRLAADDCVIIENNPLRINTYDLTMFYTNKIVEAERTMDVNIKTVKTPFLITCDDNDVLTFKRIFQMIDGNTPVIYADKGMKMDAINVLKTDAVFMGNDIMDYKKCVENEYLTVLGYNNLAVDKKERVNVEEAESNNEVISAFALLQLEARQKAADAINEKYGLKISVKFREGGENNVERDNVQHNEADRTAS